MNNNKRNISDKSSASANVIHTIAGSESTGSAGGQTDLRVFAAYKCFGFASWTSAVSFLPSKNWEHTFTPYSLDLVQQQLEASLAYKVDAVKIGMLGTLETANCVAQFLKKTYHKTVPIIVDPVLVCKGNSKNTQENPDSDFTVGGTIDKALIENIFPLASVVTPNLEEAEILSGMQKIKTADEMIKAGEEILKLGAKAAIIKGGNRISGKDAIDVLVTNQSSFILSNPKSEKGTVTGAGCTFSAALTAELSKNNALKKGNDFVQDELLEKAFASAKAFTLSAIENAIDSRLPLPAANPF